MIASILSRLGLGGSPRSAGLKLLLESFEPLNKIQKGLAESVLGFVADGKNPEILLQLQNNPQVTGDFIARPGRLNHTLWIHGYTDESLFKPALLSARKRSEFYTQVTEENTPPELLSRLGKVLHAVDKGQSLQPSGLDAPEWFQYLLNDVVFSGTLKAGEYQRDSPARPGWRVSLLAAILSEEQQPGALAFLVLFECKEISGWSNNPLAHLRDLPQTVPWLIEQGELVRRESGSLSAAGRKALAGFLGSDVALAAAFPDLLIALATDPAKMVREVAVPCLNSIPEDERIAGLGRLLQQAGSDEKLNAVDLLARIQSPQSLALLDAALQASPGKSLEQALRSALSRLNASLGAGSQAMPDLPAVQIAAVPSLPESVLVTLLDSWRILRAEHESSANEEIAGNQLPGAQYKSNWRQNSWREFQKLDEKKIRSLFNAMNGDADPKRRLSTPELNVLEYQSRIAGMPEVQLAHVLQIVHLTRYADWFWVSDFFQKWLKVQGPGQIDLRVLAAHYNLKGFDLRGLAHSALCEGWNTPSALDVLPAEAIWPFFAEYPQFLEEALGMRLRDQASGQHEFSLSNAFCILELFPVIPARYVARVLELALGEGKTYRLQAQAVASRLPDISALVAGQLQSGKQEQRIVAVLWLTKLGARAEIPALYDLLKKEKSETVRAALLTALEALGEDIRPFLSPEVLLTEAVKGLKGKIPAALDGYPLDALPAVCWAENKQPVPVAIIQWWVVLTFKLKEPAGNALNERWLSLLEPSGRAALSRFVFRRFIEDDTRHPSAEEAAAYADANAPGRFQMYQRWAGNQPEYAAKTLEVCFEELRREKAAEYLGSAIQTKGVLALVSQAPAHEIVSLLRNYMRDHYSRTAQIMAMLEACAGSNDPIVIQFLLSVSRRYRTASVQEKARQLVERIAERKQWTHDQLADRTIPAAGFDENGQMAIEYGERVFTVVLDGAMKPQLLNPDGKQIKSLPEPRKSDAAASVKEGKQLWSVCKKELKQIIELQGARLYEAMCAGRLWPVAEWQEFLQQHPVVGRLVQQLVWLQTDAAGTTLSSFRPAEDGSLINTDDDEVSLPADGFVRLAHASLFNEAGRESWQLHLKDYKIKPLFAQLGRALPSAAAMSAAKGEISEREGWLSDAFTLRGHLTKLGYQHAAAEDGGFFDHYFKAFGAAGLRACIGFSGNCLPEENVPAALTRLYFEKLGGNRWNAESVALSEVPPVLLGEAYADYLAVAEAGAHDRDWKKKIPW